MLSFIRSYKYQNVFIIMLLLLQNLLLLASTLTTMRMARLVMDGDFEGIVRSEEHTSELQSQR